MYPLNSAYSRHKGKASEGGWKVLFVSFSALFTMLPMITFTLLVFSYFGIHAASSLSYGEFVYAYLMVKWPE